MEVAVAPRQMRSPLLRPFDKPPPAWGSKPRSAPRHSPRRDRGDFPTGYEGRKRLLENGWHQRIVIYSANGTIQGIAQRATSLGNCLCSERQIIQPLAWNRIEVYVNASRNV